MLRTDKNGTVTVTTDGVTWTVTTGGQPLTPCIGDSNGDSVVDVFDLVIVSRAYNPSGPVSDPRGDVNGDGVVNLYDLVLVATSYGCDGQRPPPPAPTATPTATVMPLRTPTPTATTDGQIEVTTWLSNSTPPQYSTVTVYGRITGAGVGIAGVPMHTTWHYKTTTSYCDGTSGSDGIASCSRYISGATKGYYVSITVGFTYQGQQHYASTGFTPH